jgi:hypothetical protein
VSRHAWPAAVVAPASAVDVPEVPLLVPVPSVGMQPTSAAEAKRVRATNRATEAGGRRGELMECQ